ncbi:MAG TPA: NAD(P)/FAD-dependent oxidoreductase [Nocardioidaceae bacterium]|nr:NAD(P)/FAD-dependent oxidoreductase [Nocardioidaceae bacterium]
MRHPAEVDVVVIGLGPGGEALATELGRAGLDVIAVDRRLVGGECPYYGCIPTKMMVRAADLLAEARRIDGRAGSSSVTPAWSDVARRISDEATAAWDDTAAVERLESAGVRFVRGEGRLAGRRTVEVEGTTYTARRGVVLNTGTEPSAPPIDGLAQTPYWTNRDAVRVERLPESLIVLGGGAIGAEIGQAFSRFGVRVTVVENAPRILAVEEPEAGDLVGQVFTREGIEVLTSADTKRVSYDGGRFALEVDGTTIHAERLLVATGRRANLSALGLESVGLDPSARMLEVDEHLRAAEGLWAIGDITGKGAFTHVSMYQARIAARDIRRADGPGADYRAVPRVTFTDPEVGSVGLTARQAVEQGITVRTATTDLAASTRGWIHGAEGLVKLVEDADRGILVGGTAVGPAGGEMLSMLTTAVHAEVPTGTLRSMIYAYPTFHRAVESALDVLR